MKVSELSIGESAEIVSLKHCGKSYRQKLMAMGLTPGVIIKLLHQAPLGDPIEIKVRGYSLCLRKAECDGLQLERCS